MKRKVNGKLLELIEGDITTQETDAVVNAANSALQLGAGVAGAIRRQGGGTIQEECDLLGGCPVGGAVVTGAGNLPAHYVIHAVGPRLGEGDEEAKLAAATAAALERGLEKGLRSMALPAISTGIFGFPVDKAASIMLGTVIDHLRGETTLERVVFCLFGRDHLRVFEQELARRLP